jgi:hypothetical protein
VKILSGSAYRRLSVRAALADQAAADYEVFHADHLVVLMDQAEATRQLLEEIRLRKLAEVQLEACRLELADTQTDLELVRRDEDMARTEIDRLVEEDAVREERYGSSLDALRLELAAAREEHAERLRQWADWRAATNFARESWRQYFTSALLALASIRDHVARADAKAGRGASQARTSLSTTAWTCILDIVDQADRQGLFDIDFDLNPATTTRIPEVNL